MSETANRRGFIGSAVACVAVAAAARAEGGQTSTKAAVEKAVADCRAGAEAMHDESLASYGKALVARFGPGVVDTIRETTIARARQSIEKAPARERGLEAVKSLLWDRLDGRFQWRVVERTPTRLRFEVTKCPVAEAMRRHGAAELGFAYNCAYDVGFCQGLNPALRFTRTKTLMMGDAACDHTYELDAPAPPRA